VIVARVPASSANLGPGFDALGMALSIVAEIGVGEPPDDSAKPVEERHPAQVAFEYGGGEGEVWVRSSVPVGRGVGFSAVMRVGGLLAAGAQRDPNAIDRLAVLAAAIDLEGHADNAAACLFGGVVATAAGAVVPVRLAVEPSVVLWIPEMSTSTRRSRATLPSTVSFGDATFNVGRTALLVAALAAGDVEALRTATEDRLHQDVRFAATVPSRLALAVGLEAGAWAGWLSGSGPSVALMCAPTDAERLAATLTDRVEDGRAVVTTVDHTGATVEDRPVAPRRDER
jgi:homoserine kinase